MPILNKLSEAIEQNGKAISAWYQKHQQAAILPFYASVDVRNSGDKLAAIDTNLFPAGFNNIYGRDLQVASGFVATFLKKKYSGIKRVLILPEEHTRNAPYLKNLLALKRLVTLAGLEVRFGTLSEEMRKDQIEIDAGDGESIKLDKATIEGKRLKIPGFDPDMVLLNNDFSDVPPGGLDRIEQPIEPPLAAGWFSRRKSNHLKILDRLVQEFCGIIDVDPWLMTAETELVTGVDINDGASRERLAEVAETVLQRIRTQYEAHGLKKEPYLFLKDNSGTYGFAVMSIKSPQDILNLNSKLRRKMSSGKGKNKVDELLVQEGIPTEVRVEGCPAEPVIYLAAGEVIGGFLRKNCGQDELQSLNVRGSVFSWMTFSSPLETQAPVEAYKDDVALQVYGNLARIAYLAAGYELKEFGT